MTPAIPPGLTGALVVVSFVALFGFEAARPLRRRVEARVRRVARNLGTAGLSALAVLVLQPLVLVPAASAVVSHRVGLLALLDLPRPLAVALGVVLLDATLWIWHWLNHRVPLLWRFHLVHHVDLDLDVSTGLRFHFGEMALSVVYRAAQVALLGADPLAVSLWQLLLIPAVLFQHSNLRMPLALERGLVHVLVTPRMHGIHHSVVRCERDSNYSSLLTVWDRLAGTLCLDVPQAEVTIGVPEHQDATRLTFGRILALPFQRLAPPLAPPDERPLRERRLDELAE